MNLHIIESTKKYKIVIALIIIYILGVILYYCLGSYSKNLFFVPDERLYIQAAKALANGDVISYNGMSSTFQKIVYSIIISPAFMVKDLHIQIRLVCLIGSMAEMTYIFPVYLISRQLNVSRTKSLLLSLFGLSFPTLLFSMTFMSETAFLPLWLWMIYLIILMLDTDKTIIVIPVLAGVVGYILYMCKEVGVVALPAFVFVKIFLVVEDRDNRGDLLKVFYKEMIPCIISCSVLLAIYFIIKYIVFCGASGSYSYELSVPIAPEASDMNPISFFLYASVYYLGYIILVNYIFPIFIRSNKRDLNHKLTLYLEISFFILLIAVVYKISIKEDYGLMSPRLHLRYFEPLFIPYLVCFVARLDDIPSDKIFDHKYTKIGFGLFLIVLLLLPGLNSYGFLDATTITAYLIPEKLAYYFYLGSLRRTVIITFVMKLLILSVVLFETWLIRRNKKIFFAVFLTIAFLLNITSDGIKYKDIRKAYELSECYLEEMQDINDEMRSLDGRKLMIAKENTRIAEIMVTYYDIDNTDVYLADEDYSTSKQVLTLKVPGASRDVNTGDYSYVVYANMIWDDSDREKIPPERIVLSTENFFILKNGE